MKEVLTTIFLLDESDILTHDDYKKRYSKLSIKKFQLNKDQSSKVIGKREYDKNPIHYNSDLLVEIKKINNQISDFIQEKDYNQIRYNETTFDSLTDCTFSHDSLITIAKLLSNQFSLFNKIISDKFDFIFIDEYQDTHPYIIELFLEQLPSKNNTTIGLFGDSMQGIYDDGIGSVKTYTSNGILKLIPKEDNYRCSSQVVDFINQLRDDSLEQSVALKNGETINERQGYVKFYYTQSVRPAARSDKAEKDGYLASLKTNIEKISKWRI
ncbi:UvrD-helicase domain-containing protein [Sphingobacterium sp. KU25419]|nr:UvrD-helicase domain-containing protein [Sphingobacterium sp. KU25419]